MKLRRLKAGLLLAIPLLLVTVPGASGHAIVISTNPVVNSVLTELPENVELVFDSQIIDLKSGNSVRIINPDGIDITTGDLFVGTSELRQGIMGKSVEGKYTVSYRVVSEDGHVVTGEYSFSIQHKAQPVAEQSSTAPQPVTSSPTPSPTQSAHQNHESFISHHSDHILWTIFILLAIASWAFYIRRSGF